MPDQVRHDGLTDFMDRHESIAYSLTPNSVLRTPNYEGSTFPARFFNKMDIRYYHSPINGLAHVVNGKACRSNSHEPFHLYARLGFNLNFRLNIDSALFFMGVEIDLNMRKIERVTHGNDFRGFFCRHDSGYLGHR